jgi:GGDEF domain-containing protein
MCAALLFVGGFSVAAENLLMAARALPAGDRWIAYVTSLVFIGLSIAMARVPERMPLASWPLLSTGSVPVDRVAERGQPRSERGEPDRVVPASVGLADTPMHGRHPRDLMRSADQALYEAKGAGRNQVRAAA